MTDQEREQFLNQTCPDVQDENGADVSQIDYMLSLTPEQRLAMLGRWMDFDKAMTDARIKQYGFDPRDVVEAE
jgi:hypothetical protein